MHSPPTYGVDEYRNLNMPAKTTYYGLTLPGAAQTGSFTAVDPADKHLASFAAKSKSKYKPKKLQTKLFEEAKRGSGPGNTGPINL